MGIVVGKDDFEGEFGITQKKAIINSNSIPDGLISFIDREEKKILMELLGTDLFAAFEATPTDPVYNPLYAEQLICDEYSEGLKTMLLCMLYYQYYKTQIKNTAVGQQINDSEVSTTVGNPLYNSVMYNRGVKTYNLLGQYLSNNTATFPLYLGGGSCCNAKRKGYIIL